MASGQRYCAKYRMDPVLTPKSRTARGADLPYLEASSEAVESLVDVVSPNDLVDVPPNSPNDLTAMLSPRLGISNLRRGVVGEAWPKLNSAPEKWETLSVSR